MDTTATAAVVAGAIPVFILAHPVFDLLGLATVQGKIVNKRTIMYATKIVTIKCGLRDNVFCVWLCDRSDHDETQNCK